MERCNEQKFLKNFFPPSCVLGGRRGQVCSGSCDQKLSNDLNLFLVSHR